MSRALAWIRKSKGSDDDIGLEQQRRDIPALAREFADTVDVLDLGVWSGFSTLTRNDDSGLLDQHEDVPGIVDELRDGTYDYLVAHDDRRICRDDYLSVIEYACVQGDCEIVFLSDDVQEDDLAYDIHRRVERQTKEEEIKKSKAAIRERQERGYWQGGEPFGLEFDDDGRYLVPSERFEDALTVFDRLGEGVAYREIESEVGVSAATISRMKDRGREFYESRNNESGE